MKTIEEFYKEIASSKDLQEELKKLSEEALLKFLQKHDCKASAKDFADFAKSQEEGEIQDDAAKAAAGGSFAPVMTPQAAIHKPQGVV
ncbi:MAG: hypothetical protein IK057_04690 [Clostridia bacterium]|nr:hypothetical protein [Clostridia bacterium]